MGMISLQLFCSTTAVTQNIKLSAGSAKIETSMVSLAEVKNSGNAYLLDYQSTIDLVVHQMFTTKNIEPVNTQLIKIEKELTGFDKIYWKAYLYYYEAIFYKTIAKNEDLAQRAIETSLIVLKDKTYNQSEYYALLATCTSFSIQYVNIIKLSKVSAETISYAQKSLALNKANLRAYLVLASHNFHTPKMFGGMKKVESYALEGLSCPDELESNQYAPSWGREQLYQLLVQYYELEGRTVDLDKLKKNHSL